MRNILKQDIQAPEVLARNVEKLALQIHEQYIQTKTEQFKQKEAKGEITDEDRKEFEEQTKPFNELSSHLKLANIRQARSIPEKLNMIGCEIANEADKREEIKEF